jgi:hypothetical protein
MIEVRQSIDCIVEADGEWVCGFYYWVVNFGLDFCDCLGLYGKQAFSKIILEGGLPEYAIFPLRDNSVLPNFDCCSFAFVLRPESKQLGCVAQWALFCNWNGPVPISVNHWALDKDGLSPSLFFCILL